ncbi:hypothetical protein GCM10022288_06050 [Gryllotalpicola kribbensis]|jgi:hypothetical protein|uniref:DUF397 domain-containing protein n=1 Tax=Gryllotalpicola kribbensis TaxID=993084 RepID=A0ABP8AJB8_9MICO
MAGAIVVPSPTAWEALLQRVGMKRGPRRRSPLALRSPQREPHAEIFMSERTGDWIRVGCDCRLGYDHWHLNH